MARKRVVEPSGVKTWEDANDALRQIAEAQLAVQDIEGEMNKQILGAKKAAEEQSKPHKDRIAKLERELKDFVTEHRADMGKAEMPAAPTIGLILFLGVKRLSTFTNSTPTTESSTKATRPRPMIMMVSFWTN